MRSRNGIHYKQMPHCPSVSFDWYERYAHEKLPAHIHDEVLNNYVWPEDKAIVKSGQRGQQRLPVWCEFGCGRVH